MDDKTKRCLKLMEEGVDGDGLIEILCEEFNINAHAADWVVKEAMVMKDEVKTSGVVPDQMEHIKKRMRIFENATTRGDNELALKALQDLGRLTGVYEEKLDKEMVITFKFPDAVGYKPLDRETIRKAAELAGGNSNTI